MTEFTCDLTDEDIARFKAFLTVRDAKLLGPWFTIKVDGPRLFGRWGRILGHNSEWLISENVVGAYDDYQAAWHKDRAIAALQLGPTGIELYKGLLCFTGIVGECRVRAIRPGVTKQEKK